MARRIENLGDENVADSGTSQKRLRRTAPLPSLEIVIDLTEAARQLEFEFRHGLTPDAALLVAPSWMLGVKRLVDVVGAAVVIILLSPVLLVAVTAVKLTSRGPAFFSHQRTGAHGREFRFYKFRSMSSNAEQERELLLDLDETDGPIFKIRKDPRLTPIGRFIRRTSVDELPQLWNVLRGEMSLVGPRPLPTGEAAHCSDWEAQRLSA